MHIGHTPKLEQVIATPMAIATPSDIHTLDIGGSGSAPIQLHCVIEIPEFLNTQGPYVSFTLTSNTQMTRDTTSMYWRVEGVASTPYCSPSTVPFFFFIF